MSIKLARLEILNQDDIDRPGYVRAFPLVIIEKLVS